jgi:hypothetical protein
MKIAAKIDRSCPFLPTDDLAKSVNRSLSSKVVGLISAWPAGTGTWQGRQIAYSLRLIFNAGIEPD